MIKIGHAGAQSCHSSSRNIRLSRLQYLDSLPLI